MSFRAAEHLYELELPDVPHGAKPTKTHSNPSRPNPELHWDFSCWSGCATPVEWAWWRRRGWVLYCPGCKGFKVQS